MILVDTSVWVSHFRRREPHLGELLVQDAVYCHPLIIGELACGNLSDRQEILGLLQELPSAASLNHLEVLGYIERHRLMGRGLGIVDVFLLAAVSLSELTLWTHDKVMRKAAGDLKLKVI